MSRRQGKRPMRFRILTDGPSPYLQPALARARLSGQPIARRVESYPSPHLPLPLWLAFPDCCSPLREVANGASSTAPRIRLALPPPAPAETAAGSDLPGVDLDPTAHAQSRPVACSARFCLLRSELQLRSGGSLLCGRSCFSHVSPCAPAPDLPFSFYAFPLLLIFPFPSLILSRVASLSMSLFLSV